MKSLHFLTITLLLLSICTLPMAATAQSNNMVRLVYFLPNDRPARPERVSAFQQLIKDAQTFYADQMEAHGYGRKTFRVETDKDGRPVVHPVNGKFNDDHYQKSVEPGVWEEVIEHFEDFQHVYFIAIDVSSEILGESTCGLGAVSYFSFSGGFGFVPLTSGGLALRHREITPRQETLGGYAIIPASGHCFFDDVYTQNHPLRVTTHELAHAFGLDHDFSDPDSAVGGRGFRFSECAAEWLSVSRYFNSNPASENTPGNIQLISAPTYSAEGIALHFEVTDADGLHQAQLLVPEDGSWGPWKLIGCQTLDGQTQRVEFLSSELTSAPERVMLQFMDDLGNITWATFFVDIASLLPRPKVVSIPDRNLAAAVRKALDLGANARITDQAMQRLTRLDARKSQIKNLTGLEHATRLVELALFHNQIQDVSPLAGLIQLQRLYLQDNQIRDITPLAKLTQLRQLHLWDNQIRDISILKGLTQLESLWLESNQVRDISPLAGLTQLRDLKLNGNPIQDMSPLRTLLNRNPNLDVDIEIPPLSPVVHLESAQRPPMYWVGATTGTLHRLVGDAVETLVPNVKNATSLAVDIAGGKLYWTEKTGKRTGRIRRANLDGTNVRLVKKLTSVPYGIALDTVNGKLYLTNAYGKVQRLNLDGSNFQPNLITDLDTPRNLVLDVTGGKVYWTETTETSGRIRRANLDGSGVQNVATGLVLPLSLAVANGKIYWTEGATENVGELHFANLDGTNSELIETLPIAPTGIAVDPARRLLYLTLPSGGIYRLPVDGSGGEPVVTGLVAPSNIVLGITATTPGPTDAPEPSTTPAVDAATDVNQDQKVNKTDLLLVVTALGEKPPTNPNFDVNADGAVNIADVLLVIEALDDPVAAAAPSLGETITPLDPAFLTIQIDILRAESDGSMKYEHAIAFFQGLLASIRPTETQLLANYPNPFNPETWIPYQLTTESDVRITIYNVRGSVVRVLVLGHQPAGFYMSRSRAAYWDGRNAFGEKIASGVYFYTLTASDFTATRRMLVRK